MTISHQLYGRKDRLLCHNLKTKFSLYYKRFMLMRGHGLSLLCPWHIVDLINELFFMKKNKKHTEAILVLNQVMGPYDRQHQQLKLEIAIWLGNEESLTRRAIIYLPLNPCDSDTCWFLPPFQFLLVVVVSLHGTQNWKLLKMTFSIIFLSVTMGGHPELKSS